MKHPTFKPASVLAAVVILLAAAALWGVWSRQGRKTAAGRLTSLPASRKASPESEQGAESNGFHEAAVERGLDFQMAFLPNEQGEKFKVNLYDHGCGLAVADYDGDGHDDVLLLNQLGANALYRNRGDGSFARVTDETSPLALADRVCVGAAFGDYDNDGDQDLYITSTRGGNALFRNDGGHFCDATEVSGLGLVAHSQTPAFFDYDNDGDLDLYVTNTAKWTSDDFDDTDRYYVGPAYLREFLEGGETDVEYNVLFQNDGRGHFVDVTSEAGLQGRGWCGDLAVFDYDDDGDLDLFVANMFGLGQLYRNEGNGSFHDVTRETLRRTSFGAVGCKAFDYDNDGRLDLFIADMHSDMWQIPKKASRVEERKKLHDIEGAWRQNLLRDFGESYRELFLFGNSLFHNDGNAAFTETSDAAGMETFWPWGIAAGDFDNDGDQDAFLPSGMGHPFYYWRNYLMFNRGDGTFREGAESAGIEPPPGGTNLPQPIGGKPAARSSRSAAAGDFNGDGRLDLIVNNFNDRPYYFINQFPRRHYVAFRLRGTRSNRDAIGATVRLRMGDGVLVRQVDCSGGYLSQSSKTLHFGLNGADRIEHAEVRWPSGTRQSIGPLEVDRLHELTEPEPD